MKLIFLLLLISTVQQVFSDPYHTFTDNGKVGLKNQQGTIVVPAQYEALGWSNGTFSVVENKTGYKLDGQWGLITISNQRITLPEYASLVPGDNSLLIASKQSPLSFRISSGCINLAGKAIIPFQYSGIRIHHMRAVVYTLDGGVLKYGMIGLDNKLLIPQVYQNIYPLGSLRFGVQNFQHKTALFSEAGKQITDFVIDSISPIQNNLAIIYQNGKQGLINRDGIIINEPTYREIKVDSGVPEGRVSNEWTILTATNGFIKKLEADSLLSLGNNRLKILTASGVQLSDLEFNILETPNISQLQSYRFGLAEFMQKQKVGVLREDGSVLLPATFDRIQVEQDYILTSSSTLGKTTWALYSLGGQRLTSKAYDLIEPFNGSFYPVRKNGFYGGVDRLGNEIIACTYDSLLNGYENLVTVKFRGAFGIITLNEEWKIIPQPNPIKILNTERYFEFADNVTFLKSITGSIVYFTTNSFEISGENLIERTSSGGKWTINLNGQIIHREEPHDERNEKIYPSSEGLRGIKKNGKYGFIDDRGRLRIANRYEDILPFHEGLAAAKIRGKWGFINREDKIAIQPAFEEVASFKDGYARVKQHGKYGLLKKDGQMALDARYDQINVQHNGRILITSEKSVGLADAAGNILLQPKYESVQDLNTGYVIVKQNRKYGLVTLQGVSTIPLQYDLLLFEATKNVFFGLKKSEFLELKL